MYLFQFHTVIKLYCVLTTRQMTFYAYSCAVMFNIQYIHINWVIKVIFSGGGAMISTDTS